MTTLDPDDGNIALINTFTVKPGMTEELLARLTEATEATVKYVPGFVSANLHVSLDGKKVVNYAQWKSKDAFEAAMKNPEFQKHMKTIQEVIEGFDPVLYQLRYAHSV